MQGLEQDIKSGQLSHINLLYGTEDYLRKQYRDKLKVLLTDPSDTMNFHYFEGKDVNQGKIIDLAETMPFFADKRVIFLENTGLFRSEGEQLADYLTNPSETVYFVFIETDIDKRSRLYKVIKAQGRVAEFAVQEERILKIWILGILKREGKKISENTLNLLLGKTGTDMENIHSELEKLVCYTMNKEVITDEDVEQICTHQINNQIFEMITAIAEKEQKKALDFYYELLALREPPLRILTLITRQYNLLMQVKDLKNRGYDTKKIAEKTGLYNGYIADKYIKQGAKFKMEELKRTFSACVTADEEIKTGVLLPNLSLELLIIQCSMSDKKG